ncbi:hypothetical protein [Variovorax saccharolyticus]|uniref:hypothetical protein n=1 Tax=Variovorax saccharolyticus TaxID=3053516 RepID=UPI0025762450|nr:hypothetical protein [Variovorax sp. J22R187]MDM0018174.1 hypothetical protein [Variovorax sp. J22R187]
MPTFAAHSQAGSAPGLQPYTPTRIEWLEVVCNGQLRAERTSERPYSLSIVQSDHETLLIFVRYVPSMSGTDRTNMNRDIDTAREVIKITAKSFGWDKWLKVKEDVLAR